MTTGMNKVLVVVAHPDDEVLGCGATIDKIVRSGGQVRVLVLGEGSSCRYPREMIDSEQIREDIAQRRRFADAALAVLGVSDAVFGDLPCGRFDTVPIIDIGKKIEAQITDFQPDTVITHFVGDANSDHRITLNAVIAATRPIPRGGVKTVLSFETPSSTEWRFVESFQPNFFVNVTAHIDQKIKAFDCYSETEGRPFPFPRCTEGLRTFAKFRGMQVGVDYAEAYHLVRTIVDPN
jgi:LmbE family N-acetylglucosaminyl deacetylase